MSDLEILSLVITIISLVCFSVVFTFLFRSYFHSQIREIEQGYDDVELLLEDLTGREKSTPKKVLGIVGKAAQYLLLGCLALLLASAIYERVGGGRILIGDSTVYVIASGSMSYKNPNNGYLDENGLDNQFNTYDVIGITRYASQEDVKLYDVIAYISNQGTTICHRIVEIETVDGMDYYVTRGDAVEASDAGSLYGDYLPFESIIGYYNGFRMRSVGAFVIFLQSGAGIVTVVSIIYCYAMFEFYRRKLDKCIDGRKDMLNNLIGFEEDSRYIETRHSEEIAYLGKTYTLEVNKDDSSDFLEEEANIDGKEEDDHGQENED